MLYTIGTAHELSLLPYHLPEELVTEVLTGLVVLDAEYGESRNYYESGGYSVIAETVEDIPGLKAIPFSICQAVSNHPSDRLFRIPILNRKGLDVCPVILLDDNLLDPFGVEEAHRKADLLPLEHLVDGHSHIHTQFLANFLVNRIEQFRVIHSHPHHLSRQV